MNGQTWLKNHFLIAMPSMADPNFSKTVTYLCEHNHEGALGVIINRPLEITLSEVFEQSDIQGYDPEVGRRPVYFGGPVQTERGFVLHEPLGGWHATLPVTETIGLTTSRDILEAIARGEGPERFLMALGYAGWGSGQLEGEFAQNAWLSAPADPKVIFELPPESRWEAAARLIGIDIRRIAGEPGHA